MSTTTEQTQDIARRYFAAWTSRDSDTVRGLLAEDLRFAFTTAGTMVVEGRDAFLSGEAWPEGVKTTLLAEAYQGDTAFQMYEARNGSAELRVVEKFVVRDGRIADIVFVTDGTAYERFRAG